MKTALIIDEDAVRRQVNRHLLEEDGWHVLEADDGTAALELSRRVRPDAVLCDVSGPRQSGLEACRLLRHDPTLRRTKIIAISRRDCDCNRITALEAGADECLSGPIQSEELFRALTRPAGAPLTGEKTLASSDASPRLRFWGVRGSTPTPGPATVRYGGNTSCVEVRAAGEIIILDAGTGLRPLGRALAAEFADRPLHLTLLLTHTHWDHIHGLPYFRPIYKPNNHIRILGYEGARKGLANILSAQMESPYFPIGFDALPSNVTVEELKDLQFDVGPVRVQAHVANHPGTCVGYRLFTAQGSIAFFPDNELGCRRQGVAPAPAIHGSFDPARGDPDGLAAFLRGVDVMIMDAQYTASEYEQHVGWGHGCVDEVVALALKAEARQLFLFHHDPDHDDGQIARMVQEARGLVAARGGVLHVEAAREGLTVHLPVKAPTAR